MAAAINLGEAAKVFGIGAVIGALGFYILSKTNIQISPNTGNTIPAGQTTVPTTMPTGQATTLSAKAYPAFGYDFADDGWNNSEVWDTRNRTYFSDNILFNKLPYIPMTTSQDFNPQMLPFSQAYDHNIDQDSPRPRFGTHALDREIADQVYPRKSPLPFYF